jgi:hypothetical protein
MHARMGGRRWMGAGCVQRPWVAVSPSLPGTLQPIGSNQTIFFTPSVAQVKTGMVHPRMHDTLENRCDHCPLKRVEGVACSQPFSLTVGVCLCEVACVTPVRVFGWWSSPAPAAAAAPARLDWRDATRLAVVKLAARVDNGLEVLSSRTQHGALHGRYLRQGTDVAVAGKVPITGSYDDENVKRLLTLPLLVGYIWNDSANVFARNVACGGGGGVGSWCDILALALAFKRPLCSPCSEAVSFQPPLPLRLRQLHLGAGVQRAGAYPSLRPESIGFVREQAAWSWS